MSDDMMTPDEAFGLPDGSEQLDQLGQRYSLVDRGVPDMLDEGYTAPDHWSAAQGYGNTARERLVGETIEQRVAQEEPEEDPHRLRGPWNPDGDKREVGSKRAGRLVAPGGVGEDVEAQSLAEDVGISGGAASAEEAAMYIIDENADEDEDDSELGVDDEDTDEDGVSRFDRDKLSAGD